MEFLLISAIERKSLKMNNLRHGRQYGIIACGVVNFLLEIFMIGMCLVLGVFCGVLGTIKIN